MRRPRIPRTPVVGNTDDTVLILPPRRRVWPFVLGLVLFATLAAGGLVLRMDPGAPTAPPAPPPLVTSAPPGEAVRYADEAAILADVSPELVQFRFAARPEILVLDFAELQLQGRMLNRVAAWMEKAGVPHDRLLDDAELNAAILASGTTPDEYYFGHDYRGSDLVRFFVLADRDHVELRPEEMRLRRLVKQAQASPEGFGALISIPRTGPRVSLEDRAAILHHELSHGEYFSNPAYARYVAGFWSGVMSDGERSQVRTYLAREGYDPALEDVMMNEMQAYLIFTPDPKFFDEALLGIPLARLAELRTVFRAGMPEGWLRDQPAGPVVP